MVGRVLVNDVITTIPLVSKYFHAFNHEVPFFTLDFIVGWALLSIFVMLVGEE